MLYYSDKVYHTRSIIMMINKYKEEKWGKDLLKSYFDLETIK